MSSKEAENRRLGWVLALIVAGLTAYSFIVIKMRGRMMESASASTSEKILKGL